MNPAAAREDALFLASAPVVVPEDLGPDFSAMGIRRLYVAGASLSASGRVVAFPPPPSRISLPVTFVLVGTEGASSLLAGDGKSGRASGEAWAAALARPLAEARGWASVTALHLHLLPPPGGAAALAGAAAALKKATGLPVSVTVPAGAGSETWKPLVGIADEALLFGFGRRPEFGDRMMPEPTEAQARSFPLPFRLLMAPGGYGRAGTGEAPGRLIPDGSVDRLSEDRNLDWDFGQFLSTEAGNQYNFRPRAGIPASRTSLATDGGQAGFRSLSLTDLTRLLSTAGRWAGSPMRGRVFLVDGLPSDGHAVGFPQLKALLEGQSIDPRLEVSSRVTGSGRGGVEFVLKVGNVGASTSTLSRFENWLRLRVEGGSFAAVSAGDFDRFELLSAPGPEGRPAPFSRATVCKLYENLFASGEMNDAGPFRVSGARLRVFASWRLVLTDGRAVEGQEVELDVAPPVSPRPPKKR